MRRIATWVVVAVACVAPAFAVGLDSMKGFEAIFGRYGPNGDCTKYPQVVIDAAGFALDRGKGRVERANRPEYAASYMGNSYDGIAQVFFPYWNDAGPNPFTATVNANEKRGALLVEGHDFGWKGGPPMPPRYQPWLQGSPYAKCK
ncbi:MAG: hypothetical protein EOP93_00940 [Lysobacteraceae bacterium]|nr:MAG: hypothetical protein EOP93_00940 [Xanthomonadaceae bacterium]